MKTLIIFVPIVLFMFPSRINAQPGPTTDTIVIHAAPKEKQVFKSIAIVHYKQRAHLEFAVRKVQNVRNYRIEAGDDSASLMIIGNVVPGCNTVMPSAFAYPLNGNTAQYRYYRVVQVSMGHDWIRSPLLTQFSGTGYADKYVNGSRKDSSEAMVSILKQ